MTEQISLLDDQLVDMRFITKLTGLTDKWFYKLIKDGLFPRPIKLGRSSRWKKSEVELWLQPGQLIVMRGETQQYWQHRLNRSTKILQPRINLTFRQFQFL